MTATKAIALLAAVAPLVSGCTVLQIAHLVCIQEQELFCDKRDDRASLAAYRSLADEVWAAQDGCPEGCQAGDFAWGFREGFAEYVYAGGTGEPPAVPPRPYWQLDLRSTEGAAAVQSWFEGYRLGARIARDGGYRRAATLQVSASLPSRDRFGCPDPDRDCGPGLVGAEGSVEGPEAPSLNAPELVVPPAPATPRAIETDEDATNPGEILQLPAPSATPLNPPALDGSSVFKDQAAETMPAIFQIVR